ncbi:protein phosphatase 2C domain-containing protein [Aestuariimicrobium ganziense]|uniref:protein phosphatase 2C domain-containing protein n=1 Tax=Aestuariimicrobium ganziense TaxID=2773677 RepID=UPI0019436DCA|nr:protein phosphatase 2C domain-containing protein [Aestuariimicrobium ganziense]
MIAATRACSPDGPNEDAVRHDQCRAVVVDGAGVAERYRAGCSHTVAWFANALADALFEAMDDRSLALRECLRAAITTVADQHRDTCRLDQGSPSATVAAFRVDDQQVELLVLSDASVVVAESSGTRVVTDDAVAVMLDSYDPLVEDLTRDDWIEARRCADGGWWCAQHRPEAAEHALVEWLPTPEVNALLAVSDGVSRLWEHLGATPFEALGAADDPEWLLDELRAAETASEAGLRAREVRKLHDDASLVLWRARR